MAELIIWKTQEIDRLKKDMDRLLARFRDDFCSPLLLKGFREEQIGRASCRERV